MTFRISQFAVVCGLGLLALPGVAPAQAPRYQSPIQVPGQVQTLPAPTPITPNGTVVEDIIARVNDQIITRSDLERSEHELAQELQQTNATPEEAAERQKNLLRDMIDQQLLLSRGKQLGIDPDAEVIRRLDEIRKQNHLDSMEALQKAAESQGVSFEDFKANIRNSVITQQVVRDEVGSRLQMSPIQEREYYAAHQQDFAQPEQVRLSEILIDTPADATDAQVEQAKAKADDIEAQIKAGAKFDEMAKKYSGDPTGAQGGDLGVYKRGALAKVLEDQTFDLPVGGVTAPIRTRQGYVILKVTEHQEAGTPPLKDVEPQVEQAMYMAQMQPALRAYLTKLRDDASIDIENGYVDTGASPKQTKFVYSAYAPPTAKKKKNYHEKRRYERAGAYSAANLAKKNGAAPATVAAPTASSSTAAGQPVKYEKPKKEKKIKTEKVRFGQAPRNALPPGPEETGVGQDVGAGAVSAAVTPGGSATGAAPGTAIAPLTSDTATDVNPLAPKAVSHGKTRYSDRARTEKTEKAQKKAQKAEEKAASAPAPMTAQEKATAATQAAPLGLNGDTAKKKKKKKAKGGQKERLQNQAPKPAPAPPVATPAIAPNRGTPLEGTPADKAPAAAQQ